MMAQLTDEQKKAIDSKIAKDKLNDYGDPKGTQYMGGTPLFNEMTGKTTDRYDFIVSRHPDWVNK